MKFSKTITNSISLRDNIRVRQKRIGFKKFAKEILQGWFTSKDKAKFSKGVYKTRIADKINDEYSEKVINAQSGKVERNVTEKLSEHHNK